MSNANAPERGLLSRRALDLFFIFQIVVNVVVLGILIAMMFLALSRINTQASRQDLIIKQQLEFVQTQNDVQVCIQHDIILAIQKLARGFSNVLGLPPLAHIDVPDTEGLECAVITSNVGGG